MCVYVHVLVREYVNDMCVYMSMAMCVCVCKKKERLCERYVCVYIPMCI